MLPRVGIHGGRRTNEYAEKKEEHGKETYMVMCAGIYLTNAACAIFTLKATRKVVHVNVFSRRTAFSFTYIFSSFASLVRITVLRTLNVCFNVKAFPWLALVSQ